MTWDKVFYLPNVISSPQAYPCIQLTGCEAIPGQAFEPWDVEISRNPTQNLALFCGGVGVQCGLILASHDDGLTWCKEWHECPCIFTGCHIACDADPNYNPAANLFRLQDFTTLYGLAIQSSDNSAIAVGYNGQQLVRDPATSVWLDRSVFSKVIPTVSGSVKFPLLGAALAGPNGAGQTIAIATGMGGLLRESIDGGYTYSPGLRPTPQGPTPIAAEPHRIKDVHFFDDSVGWHVGQHGRIANSTNGGFVWQDQSPIANAAQVTIHAITWDLAQLNGVAVGDPTTTNGEPKIRYIPNLGSSSQWLENATITGDPNFITGKSLREVEWSGTTATGNNFWAVGTGGLILTSRNGGQDWSLYVPALETNLHLYEFAGVSFMDTATGLMVGRRPNPSPNGPIRGAVNQYRKVAGVVSWASIALPPEVTKLTDVDISGVVAWAVGEKDVGGVISGVLLTSTFSSGSFGAFTEVTPPANGFPLCTIGEDLLAPILSEVEVGPSGAVWVAGMCGRVWKYASQAWAPHFKSQMDAHVVGMSFVTAPGGGDAGYLGGMRRGQQCIVRVQ